MLTAAMWFAIGLYNFWLSRINDGHYLRPANSWIATFCFLMAIGALFRL